MSNTLEFCFTSELVGRLPLWKQTDIKKIMSLVLERWLLENFKISKTGKIVHCFPVVARFDRLKFDRFLSILALGIIL